MRVKMKILYKKKMGVLIVCGLPRVQ